jgi:hypothetical protein
MIFKKKLVVLSSVLGVLVLVFVLSLVLERGNRKSAAFAWLESSMLVLVDRVEITGSPWMGGDRTILRRVNNVWFISSEFADLPARQGRVDDLLSALSVKALYPLRASSSEASERLGLVEHSASRIRVLGGAGLPLLDLLVGSPDALGREVYLRISGKREIHSGEDRFTIFTEAGPNFWYDLRVFPDAAASVDAVQQAELSLPGGGGEFTLRRSGGGWVILGEDSAVDTRRVEAWLRSVLEAEANDFAAAWPPSVEGSITLRLGDGTSRRIELGPEDAEENRSVRISASPYMYSFTGWTVNRLFREKSHFLQ